VSFLDADDEYDEHYAEDMIAGEGTLRYPRIKRIYPNGCEQLISGSGNLRERNFICIGACFRREDFLVVGGFRELPILEDWDLWLRMKVDIQPSKAIYIQHFNPNGRNQNEDYAHWEQVIRLRS